MNKRTFLSLLGSSAAVATIARFGSMSPAQAAEEGSFEIMKTEAEWRAQLSPLQYKVLREEGTERPFTSPLNTEKREGAFHCAGCDQKVYLSEHKYDSGTGWPSFYLEVKGNVAYKEDNTLFMKRTEEHCSRCGGHMGHLFTDGPAPTYMRHCINGVSLVFKPADGSAPVLG